MAYQTSYVYYAYQSVPGCNGNGGVLQISRSIWRIDKTIKDSTTQDQSVPGCNGNEGVLQIYLTNR